MHVAIYLMGRLPSERDGEGVSFSIARDSLKNNVGAEKTVSNVLRGSTVVQ